MRLIVVLSLIFITSVSSMAQTATPTPTPTQTPSPYVYSTLQPEISGGDGQTMRFDYVVSASDVHIANLLTWLLISVWSMFLYWFAQDLRRRR